MNRSISRSVNQSFQQPIKSINPRPAETVHAYCPYTAVQSTDEQQIHGEVMNNDKQQPPTINGNDSVSINDGLAEPYCFRLIIHAGGDSGSDRNGDDGDIDVGIV